MNKQELLDKAVEQFGGEWPACCGENVYMSHRPEIENTRYYPFYVTSYKNNDYAYWHVSEFQQRARELGYVNGYRWGVEYSTNGKKPDLPDDVVVAIDGATGECAGDSVDGWSWHKIKSFLITDQRYKPADTSYLQAPAVEAVEESTSWYDYENQKALRLPPVGVECEVRYARLTDWCKALVLDNDTFAYYENEHWEVMGLSSKIQFRPLDWNRKAEAERKRVVDAVAAHCDRIDKVVLFDLYDAGYLRLPADKS